MIVLAFRIVAALPGGGPGPARAVDEHGHGLVPAELFPVLDESVLPVLLFPVPPIIHELFILLVRDFIAVNEEIPDLHVLLELTSVDPDHAGGELPGLVELPQDLAGHVFVFRIIFPRGRGSQDGLETLLFQLESQVSIWHPHLLDGRYAQIFPFSIRVSIFLDIGLRPGRFRDDRQLSRDLCKESS